MEQNDRKLEALLSDYSRIREQGGQELLIELLREIQRLYGCIPPQAQRAAAAAMATAPAVIAALIRRIPGLCERQFAHKITVCTGPRCAGAGSAALLRAFEAALKIRCGGVTPDGLFSLAKQNCFKKCGTAPNIKVDETFYSNFSPDDIPPLLRQYRK